MLPLYDFLNHRTDANIVWAAGGGFVRFSASCDEGEEIYNSYGPKTNEELLSTYGFAIQDNPLDSVEIFIGQQQHQQEEDAEQASALHGTRVMRLDDLGIHHKVNTEGHIVIGPFILRQNQSPAAAHGDADTREDEEGEEASSSIIPAEVYHALAILAMEAPDNPVEITGDELDALKGVLDARLLMMSRCRENLRVSLEGNSAVKRHAQHVGIYLDGQCTILREALQEVDALLAEGESSE